jgi:hypothetical protein
MEVVGRLHMLFVQAAKVDGNQPLTLAVIVRKSIP